MSTGSAIAAEADRMVGVPWKDGGRGEGGLDCVGLVALCARRGAGLQVPIPPDAAIDPMIVARELRIHARKVPEGAQRPGDIALIAALGEATHLGVFGMRGIVHADQSKGRVVIGIDEKSGERVTSYYRLKGTP